MSISRRQFLVGTGAGLILPAHYETILAFCESRREAWLEAPQNARIDLVALNWDCADGLQLCLGDPEEEAPEMTVREFAQRYFDGEQDFAETWFGCDAGEIDFDDAMDYETVEEWWSRADSPFARAYDLLKGMDLGPDLDGRDAVGEILFLDAPSPGNDSRWVEAPTQVDLSLLQRRLNDLATGIRLSVHEH